MGRNLVVCLDGTNNQFGDVNTNVVRLIQVLHRDQRKQRIYYDPGVGTLPEPGVATWIGKKISEGIGLAFGEWHLDFNLDLRVRNRKAVCGQTQSWLLHT